MNDKLFDDNSRMKLISTMDFKTLNEYIKNMDRIAKRKGGKYLEIYNKDLDYIMSLNDTEYQDGGNLFSLFGTNNKKNNDDDDDDEKQVTMTEQVCDTEGYVQRINNIMNKAPQKETDLVKLKNTLTTTKNKALVQKFIDIVKSVDNTLTQKEYNLIKDITKTIVNDKVSLKDAFEYMGKVLDKSAVSQELVQKLSILRTQKSKLGKQQYNNEKDQLIKKYIKDLGFKNVCISKLTEKIIYVCRKK